MNIGVLSLQGDFAKHRAVIESLGHDAVLVRRPEELTACDKLIIPGGESTTFLYLMDRLNLRQSIIEFGSSRAILGTCAGLIVLAKNVRNLPLKPLGLIDISVDRNAYGRQIDSFIDSIQISLNGRNNPFEAVFIRAPKILSHGKSVTPLAYHNNDVVMARNDHILVASFHPELTEDNRIHQFFIERVG